MASTIQARANSILEQLRRDERLGQYVDGTLPLPKPYRGSGEIKRIVSSPVRQTLTKASSHAGLKIRHE